MNQNLSQGKLFMHIEFVLFILLQKKKKEFISPLPDDIEHIITLNKNPPV